MLVYCRRCGLGNREGSRYCNACGSPLPSTAPTAGLLPDWLSAPASAAGALQEPVLPDWLAAAAAAELVGDAPVQLREGMIDLPEDVTFDVPDDEEAPGEGDLLLLDDVELSSGTAQALEETAETPPTVAPSTEDKP